MNTCSKSPVVEMCQMCTTDAKANDYLLLTFDTVVFVLTFYKTFRSAAHMKKLGMTNSLTFWLLRDGFIYYFGRILLVVFDILSFSFPQFFQYDYSLEILNAVGNILINHLLLNLRHVSARQSGGGFSQNTLPEVAFASNATIGNIGAPLTEDPEEFTWALERSTEKRNDAPDMIEAESSSTLQEV
ncbi:hypothetical protein BD410DRAFT_364429 [Rickenella mellea]|uniref:Uncharacterized protein n=1 Tax=Rickenella mellea TaxID=50990 RepID=A0A4Y7Q0N5_9AGAM|nr:hypothetical protein BD410DRAFT_364429 [Rickenella mellea]